MQGIVVTILNCKKRETRRCYKLWEVWWPHGTCKCTCLLIKQVQALARGLTFTDWQKNIHKDASLKRTAALSVKHKLQKLL